jgi:hypothetical protein
MDPRRYERANRVLHLLENPILIRRMQLGLYGCSSIASLIMGIVSVTDARFPWLIIALFMGGSFVDTLREKTPK